MADFVPLLSLQQPRPCARGTGQTGTLIEPPIPPLIIAEFNIS